MEPIQRLRRNLAACFFGNQGAIDRAVTCLLARGHLLIEDVPGVGKTTLATAIARSIDAALSRIQLTPDLMPSDVVGVGVWDPGESRFVFKPGPIFANVVLADEINRATPRTQSALLEAMSESQVTVDGVTHRMRSPFLVLATQNPVEFEGTYFLPEAQLDRFLMRLSLGYPSQEDEARVLIDDPRRTALAELSPVMTCDELEALQRRTDAVKVDPVLAGYAVALARATRESERLHLGVSPRGTLSLLQAARASAVLADRDYCVPEDFVSNVIPVFGHRCIAREQYHADAADSVRQILKQVLETVPSPV
ncbi:MAG: MoxR family ATPase [Planctomycetota bacterium]